MFLRVTAKVFLIIILLSSTSCEITKSLWEDAYKEEIKQFLTSANGEYVVFVGKKYHYIFTDNSGVIKEILQLDKDRIVTIDSEETRLSVDNSNNLKSRIVLKTFDLKLSPQILEILEKLGSEKSKSAAEMFLELPLSGKRYLTSQDFGQYFLALDETYEIEVRRVPTSFKEFEKIALTHPSHWPQMPCY